MYEAEIIFHQDAEQMRRVISLSYHGDDRRVGPERCE
jgi:hypothetical protein